MVSDISIGVCVYNEEKNIRSLLNSLLNQKTSKHIKEIIVVSSACSDKTDEIIETDFLKSYPQVILLKQEKREGKASAINLFLKYASGDILVLESGDTTPRPDTIENLTESFKNPKIGMTGGRPIPVNDPNTFMGFTVHLVWELHHELAMRHPKLGELVAFRRNLIKEIPFDTAVDEAFIEALVREQGYELTYNPGAVVYNKGPETISDFFKQRRRIFAGHIHLKKTKNYTPASMKKLDILKLIIKDVKLDPKTILWTSGAMLLEFYGRILGAYDFHIKKEKHFIWNVVETTKDYLPATGYNYNPDIHSISVAKRINLWSNIRHQSTFQQSQLQPVPEQLEIAPIPLIPLESDQYSIKEEAKSSNEQLKLMIKMTLPFMLLQSIGLINDLLDIYNSLSQG